MNNLSQTFFVAEMVTKYIKLKKSEPLLKKLSWIVLVWLFIK